MRYLSHACLLLAIASPISIVQAIPVTGNNGPGGFESTQSASSLALWLNAGVIAQTDNTAIAAWNDSSFYGRNVVQGNAANQPTFRTGIGGLPNGQAVVRFAASPSQQFMDMIPGGNNILQNVSGTTMYGVAATTATTLQRYLFISNGSVGSQTRAGMNLHDTGSGSIVGGTAGSARFEAAGRRLDTDSFQRIVGGTIVQNEFFAQEGVLNYATASGSTTVNGHLLATSNTFQTAGNTSNTPSVRVRIGANGADTAIDFFRGDLAEVVVFNRTLNNAERFIVENHLAAKYDLPINPAVDFYGGKASGIDYDFDVFGVGRVDAQNQVLNAGNAGFGIEVTGGVAANQLNDGEFILAGHNNATPAIVDLSPSPEYPGERWSRIWNVDTNGSETDAIFGFNFADAGLGAFYDANDTFQLLYSQTADFSSFEILDLPFTIQPGDTITFNVAASYLIDGFYTLGINAYQVPEPGSLMLVLSALGGVMARRRKRRSAGPRG